MFSGFPLHWPFATRRETPVAPPNLFSSGYSHHRAYMIPPGAVPHPPGQFYHPGSRRRTTSTPGQSTQSRPQMMQVNGGHVYFAPQAPIPTGTHHRSRSVSRPVVTPTDAHVQAYARYQVATQPPPNTRPHVPSLQQQCQQDGYNPATSSSTRPLAQHPNTSRKEQSSQSQSRPRATSLTTPHELQGMSAHQTQGHFDYGSGPSHVPGRGPTAARNRSREGSGRYHTHNNSGSDSVPSLDYDSVPSLEWDPADTTAGATTTSAHGNRPDQTRTRAAGTQTQNYTPAPPPPDGNNATSGGGGGGGGNGGLARLARPLRLYGLTRTDSGSRRVHGRSRSVDPVGTSGVVPPPTPGPAPEIPHTVAAPPPAPINEPRGRPTRSSGIGLGLIHLVNRHRHTSTGPAPAPVSVSRPRPPPPPLIPQQQQQQPQFYPHHPHHRPPPPLRPHYTLPMPSSSHAHSTRRTLSRPRRHRIRHHVSFVNPHKRIHLNVNPLFAISPSAPSSSSSSTSHAPIYYDVTLLPSRVSVRCRGAAPFPSPSSPSPAEHERDRVGGGRGRSRDRDHIATEAVPDHVLSQPATEPPVTGSGKKILLKCDRLPWVVVVNAGMAPSSTSSGSTGSTSAGSTTTTTDPTITITNNDVLYAIYYTLNALVTKAEWDSLPTSFSSSSLMSPSPPAAFRSTATATPPPPLAHLKLSQKRVSRAYRERMDRMEKRAMAARARASLVAGRRVSVPGVPGVGVDVLSPDSSDGVRRVDWLMGRTRLVGIIMEKEEENKNEEDAIGLGFEGHGVVGVGRLIFDRP
ncbi:hypothetical protein D9757_013721 [Collybiopsis confluens]|uniref:DUF6699 domain-containing protein n=1 Tax=Collybiopsis confluens TaxID=2823264 RepID=A0A8H5CYP9_9AGAR|nr:hypothetical protein D9757_013721 [Collybiopsis confluens]